MTTKHPRINLVIEKPLYRVIESLANKNNLSLSSQVRELILEAIETYEDICLAKLADERTKTFSRRKALSHETFWKRVMNK